MPTKIFPNGGMKLHCDTFSCFDIANWFVGNDEGPLSLMTNLCDKCKQSLVDSVIELDRQGLRDRVDTLIQNEKDEERKAEHKGQEFSCKYCSEVFYSPQTLGAHTKSCKKKAGG